MASIPRYLVRGTLRKEEVSKTFTVQSISFVDGKADRIKTTNDEFIDTTKEYKLLEYSGYHDFSGSPIYIGTNVFDKTEQKLAIVSYNAGKVYLAFSDKLELLTHDKSDYLISAGF